MQIKDLLSEYKGITRMHMPGHKGSQSLSSSLPLHLDVTEVMDFDDLHHPQGVLKELNERFSRLYKSGESFVMVNGSTGGILAAMRTLTSKSSRVLVARNCHRSVMHAIELLGLDPVFITPERIGRPGIFGSVSPKSVEDALREYDDIKTVVITSPTYEGVVSDVQKIARACHESGAALLVDEAHGAHLGFGGFLGGALQGGADIVVQSLHKTLSGLNQTALLHVGGTLTDRAELKRNLQIFQTSSPSYLLLLSACECADLLKEEQKVKEWHESVVKFRKLACGLKKIRLFSPTDMPEAYGYDPSKLVLYGDFSGLNLAEILQKSGIVCEMACTEFVLAMTGVGDTEKNLESFLRALESAEQELETAEHHEQEYSLEHIAVPALSPLRAARGASAQVPIECGKGKICAEYISLYPPGVPIIVPGMMIDEKTAKQIKTLEQNGENLQKSNSMPGFVSIVIDMAELNGIIVI